MMRLCCLLALVGLAFPAQAQRRDELVGRIGNVKIDRVFENGRYDRCHGEIPLEVTVDGTTFPYRLQGVTMEQVFLAVENCGTRNAPR
ncbi:hypothetical protein HB662_20160 [Roseomonas frigidaquae]|uniref:Uncharacterized protein n=1 Tax=Falsiroseomonas frigidaquae TaxID=487318 RepID=A0ABX1F4A5_9PROT|nr:hypothetical protein [Falsiroseomonas frigidaquae]NKE47104.1 hypothetical protein [Falsiroseomonas frigidaquae]